MKTEISLTENETVIDGPTADSESDSSWTYQFKMSYCISENTFLSDESIWFWCLAYTSTCSYTILILNTIHEILNYNRVECWDMWSRLRFECSPSVRAALNNAGPKQSPYPPPQKHRHGWVEESERERTAESDWERQDYKIKLKPRLRW